MTKPSPAHPVAQDGASLRQRAARARDAAGRFIRQAVATVAGQPDPVSPPREAEVSAAAEARAEGDVELLALAGPWQDASDRYDRAAEACADACRVAEPTSPGPPPDGAGPDWEAWRKRVAEWPGRKVIEAAEGAMDEARGDLSEIEGRIAALPAASLAGLKLKARVARRNDDIDIAWPDGLGAGLARDILAIAEPAAVRPSLGTPASHGEGSSLPSAGALAPPQPVDWNSPPPGFMASPAIEPYGFVLIPEGLRIELGRLHRIALAEFARCRRPGQTAEEVERLRRELRVDALAGVARGEGGFAVAPGRPEGAGTGPPAGAGAERTPHPDRAWAVAQAAAVDLSGLSILELHNLYEDFAETADRWLDTGNAPWAKADPDRAFTAPNAAGRIVVRETNRATEICNRIATEMACKPVPAESWDRDYQLETLVLHELARQGSLRHAPDLRTRITAEWGA